MAEDVLGYLSGYKKHEVRVNDRDFREGDELWLREWDPDKQTYTGRHVLATVTYMSKGGTWGLPPDIVVMSLQLQYWSMGDAE